MDAKSNPSIVSAILARIRGRSDHDSIKAAMRSTGDITRMDGYANMLGCIERLRPLDAGGRLGKPYRVAVITHATLLKHRKVFQAAFQQGGSESMQYVYASTAAALLHLVSLLCAEAIILAKDASGSYTMTVNTDGVKELTGSIFVTRLDAFNMQADRQNFNAIVNESAPLVDDAALHESFIAAAAVVAAGVTGVIALVYIARDLVEKFFELRGTFSRWLEIQARFLEINAAAIGTARPAPRAKQEEYASRLRSLSDRIRVDDVDTERQAQRATSDNDRHLTAPSSLSPVGSAFQLV